MPKSAVLVTGAAGFIGYHLSRELLEAGYDVVGLDNVNDYYDPALKSARLDLLRDNPRFDFVKLDLKDRSATDAVFAKGRFPVVFHLAAQAGVRYSISNPHAYADSNLGAFVNVLEGCRHNGCRHLVYASSSSVYGANAKLPFSVGDRTDHPISLYAATKKSNELMAHSYSHLFGLRTTGLRFFTVYGPWYRPDMAIFLFAKAISSGAPIRLFNHGRMRRDFTHISDVMRVMRRLLDVPENAGDPTARVYNVGNHRPEELMRVVDLLEAEFGRKAEKELLPMQPGDVPETFADIDDLKRDFGFSPETRIEDGIRDFASWYRSYYGV